jgi:hypothetical protein
MAGELGPDDTKTIKQIKNELRYLSLMVDLLKEMPGSSGHNEPQTYASQSQQYESQMS